MKKRLSDFQIRIGNHEPGPADSITDVAGVRVGQVTLDGGTARTGLTVVLPAEDAFRSKLLCGAHVFNGYGKSMGLIQVDELGTLETPIVLTNTFAVGDAARGLIECLMAADRSVGRSAGTVNPVVLECNDGYLNDLRSLPVRPEHVAQALQSASAEVQEGSAGAGTGMSAYGLKGGIGTASRVIDVLDTPYMLGGLVLTNMGRLRDLVIAGQPIGQRLAAQDASRMAAFGIPGPQTHGPEASACPEAANPDGLADVDRGSIIMIVATDAPLSSRQLKRVSRRCIAGLSRTGSHMGQGSGEIALAFSTANRVPQQADRLHDMRFLPDDRLDPVFDATIEVVEEAILNAMLAAEDMTGLGGHRRSSLSGLLEAALR